VNGRIVGFGLIWTAGWILLAGPATASAATGDPNAPAQVVVTDTVIVPRERVKPLGCMGFGDTHGCKRGAHWFVTASGNEPVSIRKFHMVTAAEENWVELDGRGTSPRGQWRSGMLSGATVRIYRAVDRDGNPLPQTEKPDWRGTTFIDTTKADHIEFVGTRKVIARGAPDHPDGGWIVEGDGPGRVYLEDGPRILKDDGVFIEKRTIDFDTSLLARPAAWYWMLDGSGTGTEVRFSLAAHDEATAALIPEAEDIGESCLRVDVGQGRAAIWQPKFRGFQSNPPDWYGYLDPGRKYRLSVWLRQEGLGNGGKVGFSLGGVYPQVRTEFTVSSRWEKHVFRFTGPGYPVDRGGASGPTFSMTGPGTLWMDNCHLLRYDTPEEADAQFIPNQTLVDGLVSSQPAAGEKGVLRTWCGMTETSMKSILGWHRDTVLNETRLGDTFRSPPTVPEALFFMERTGDSPATRMRPWLNINTYFTEDEWLMLIEYLAAPYDPRADTPAAKPWAYKRYLQRGDGTPWTQVFDQIIIELGNENWHNRIFEDWIGFGRYGGVNQDGVLYGLWGRYLFGNVMENSPWWESQGLDSKILLSLGGSYAASFHWQDKTRPIGYGADAMRAGCPPASFLGMATYVGPKWETGQRADEQLTDEGYQKYLLGYLSSLRPAAEAQSAVRTRLAELGYNYDLVAYESGPSGFHFRNMAPEHQERLELYGKSLAIGVAAFDAWMDTCRLGWTWQAYYAHLQGKTWSSHHPPTIRADVRPTPAWLALTMRNRYIRGDMLETRIESGPSLAATGGTNRPADRAAADGWPLIGCYAFRDGDTCMVAVLSRKLDGAHDGADFGDGFTPVTLRLPFAGARKITLHCLTGNPRDTNIEEYRVRIQSRDVPAGALAAGRLVISEDTGGGAGGMPPGSVFIYVCEGTTE